MYSKKKELLNLKLELIGNAFFSSLFILIGAIKILEKNKEAALVEGESAEARD